MARLPWRHIKALQQGLLIEADCAVQSEAAAPSGPLTTCKVLPRNQAAVPESYICVGAVDLANHSGAVADGHAPSRTQGKSMDIDTLPSLNLTSLVRSNGAGMLSLPVLSHQIGIRSCIGPGRQGLRPF